MSDQGASWRPDPQGKHDHRWWDGSQWTDQVADAGVASTDPMTSGPSGTETVAIPSPVAPGAPGGSGGAVPPPGAPATPPPGTPFGGTAPAAQGYVPPSPGGPAKKKKWPWILGAIALLLVALVVVGLILGDDAATDFSAGECTNDELSGNDITQIETVDCEEEHTAEAIGEVELEGDDYPGADEIAEEAGEQCAGDIFEDYVGIDYQESIYFIDILPPNEEAWEDGLRTVICIINDSTEGDLEGSARDSEE